MVKSRGKDAGMVVGRHEGRKLFDTAPGFFLNTTETVSAILHRAIDEGSADGTQKRDGQGQRQRAQYRSGKGHSAVREIF